MQRTSLLHQLRLLHCQAVTKLKLEVLPMGEGNAADPHVWRLYSLFHALDQSSFTSICIWLSRAPEVYDYQVVICIINYR